MRDLIVTLAVLGSLPLIFLRPWVGVLVWVWISFMNPHIYMEIGRASCRERV